MTHSLTGTTQGQPHGSRSVVILYDRVGDLGEGHKEVGALYDSAEMLAAHKPVASEKTELPK